MSGETPRSLSDMLDDMNGDGVPGFSGFELDGEDLDLDLGSGVGGVSGNREARFSPESARFHDPNTGEFEPGGPPPDLDQSVDRYRGKNGQFKDRSTDLFDEPEEVLIDSLDPEG